MALEVFGGKNDLLISESSDHTMLVFLEFGAILIATTSSWHFPYPYRYPPSFISGLPTNGQHSLLEGRDAKNTIPL